MQKLSLGKQHFRQLREQNLIYVDKTPIIYKLMSSAGFYFFSRPRRFGKSLLIDTMKELFLGNQELFKGLWIEDKIEWKTHPVIHLDFSRMSYGFSLNLHDAIKEKLLEIADNYEVSISGQDIKSIFGELITKLSEREKVVILIDEYDKPITDHIVNVEQATKHRDVLREFYGVLKPLGDKLQFLFITGIAKFSRVSLFSTLNNLTDISIDESYSTLVGITKDELTEYYAAYIDQIVEKHNRPRHEILDEIQKMYNGYSWDGENFVYNPFSVLSFFQKGRFRFYWFSTGTPHFLIEVMRRARNKPSEIESFVVNDLFFETYQIGDRMPLEPTLFQTGYLTIKSIDYSRLIPYYTLAYPNTEVRYAFLNKLLESYSFKEATTVNSVTFHIEMALNNGDVDEFEHQLNILLSDISYHLFPFEKKNKDEEREKQEFMAWEGYFQTIVYLVLQYIGINIQCEITKKGGRMDAKVEVDDYIYIMEFNPDSYRENDAKIALDQIKEKGYHHAYQNTEKEIILMGVAFHREKKELLPIEWERYEK